MSSQRSYITIYERLQRLFENKGLTAEMAEKKIIEMYPVGSFLPTDVICGYLNFIKDNINIPATRRVNECIVSIEDNKCTINGPDYSVIIYNYRYTSTITIELRYDEFGYLSGSIIYHINDNNAYTIHQHQIYFAVRQLVTLLSKIYKAGA